MNGYEKSLKHQVKNIVVIGPGIKGCFASIALLLRKYNYTVILIDQASDIMMRARTRKLRFIWDSSIVWIVHWKQEKS
jgi:predicted NAD/FAD-dependent oxidoreductase